MNKNLFIERELFAKNLINLFKSDTFDVKNGLSISVNGEWGTGKTFFKEKFKEMLINEKFIVFEYDAWQNDFNNDPFESIISIIISDLEKSKKASKKFKKFLSDLKITSKNILQKFLPIITSILAKHYGLDEFNKYAGEIKDGTNEISQGLLKKFGENRELEKNIEDFKKLLESLHTQISTKRDTKNKRIVVLVDELDRCRPDYAIKVLERIKHFFNIPDYIFIFFVKKEQLCDSINHIYGVTNSENYLEKFFDYQLDIPNPDKIKFIETIESNIIENYETDEFKKYMMSNFFESLKRNTKQFSLRHIEKIIKYYNLIIEMSRIDSIIKIGSLPNFFLDKCNCSEGDIDKSYGAEVTANIEKILISLFSFNSFTVNGYIKRVRLLIKQDLKCCVEENNSLRIETDRRKGISEIILFDVLDYNNRIDLEEEKVMRMKIIFYDLDIELFYYIYGEKIMEWQPFLRHFFSCVIFKLNRTHIIKSSMNSFIIKPINISC